MWRHKVKATAPRFNPDRTESPRRQGSSSSSQSPFQFQPTQTHPGPARVSASSPRTRISVDAPRRDGRQGRGADHRDRFDGDA